MTSLIILFATMTYIYVLIVGFVLDLDFYQIEEKEVEEFFEVADINQCGHIAKKHLYIFSIFTN